MVIWPQKICRGDAGWDQTCALLKVLALDPRRPPNKLRSAQRQFFETAEDFLTRPLIVEDRKYVPAPYYVYALRFNVSASAHGSIPIADAEQLEEFRQVVNEALRSDLTIAERARWEAHSEFLRCCSSKDPLSEVFSEICGEQGRKAIHFYHQVQETLAASRRHTDHVGASLTCHEDILRGLILLGAA